MMCNFLFIYLHQLLCVTTDVVVGVSGEFMKGWVEAISSLGSQAYGARNYELVGQYVQTSLIGYVLCQIPMAV